MFACMCLCICVCVCIHEHVYMHLCMYISVGICMHVLICTWIHECMCICVYAFMCIFMCVCVFHEKDSISLGSWLIPTTIFLSLWRNIFFFFSKNLSCPSFLIDWKISKPRSILLKTQVRRKTRQKPEDDSQDTSHYYFLGFPGPVSCPCSLV